MRASVKTRALFVVSVGVVAAALAASQAFGFTPGHQFVSTPDQARYGHVPNTLNNHSRSTCPAGGQTVDVALIQGTTTLATASVLSDVKGRWAVAMPIPSNLKPGTYAVTASCSAGGPATLSYNPQTFRVTPPLCPSDTSTSTTVQCRVTTTSSSTTVP
ncbi:MAG: hypothetical protein JO086_17835 [Acidimicrobiia bacterium]|nr:hypothetical protein [Acidimicrobiia bacterium]